MITFAVVSLTLLAVAVASVHPLLLRGLRGHLAADAGRADPADPALEPGHGGETPVIE
ncbi:hypothetical protein GT030_00430 [Streptomyces sp. SID1328]|uniref:hypothetical protein n=1 Tax=Streptomyces sp. SID1328 TaxID=2690250 RepID=UPI0013692F11|nr:hypothetical protein [Streptomyces sp. SID1328]MYV37374.1 hypothetical protein [Streptomyces sp. SID1328]